MNQKAVTPAGETVLSSQDPAPPRVLTPNRLWGLRPPALDRFELAVLVAFAGLSLWVLALALAYTIAHALSWSGTDGVYLQDQMQYLAWIQDASRHLLVSDLFTLTPTPHDYLQPLVVISGLIAALGVPPWLSLLLWKPVAIGAIFFVVRAYVRRMVAGLAGRRAALVIALFFIGPGTLVAEVLVHLHLVSTGTAKQLTGIGSDAWVGFWTWGYYFGLIALAAMLAAVLAYDRERKHARTVGLSPLLGALASWLHPWQGGLLILLLIASEAVEFARVGQRPAWRHLILTCVVTAIPLVYYEALGRTDFAWKLSNSAIHTSVPFWIVVLCDLPLVLPSLPAYATRPLTFLGGVTRAWPIAALAVFGLCRVTRTGGTGLHPLLGINIPLAILAVQGWRSVTARVGSARRRYALTWLALGAAMLPSLLAEFTFATQRVFAGELSIASSESRALDFLARAPGHGGVLTRSHLGTVVPGKTGRPTYVGSTTWSPAFSSRSAATDDLFAGRMPARAAIAFVRGTSAKFMLVDCKSRQNIHIELAPLIMAIHRFGCASVYVLR